MFSSRINQVYGLSKEPLVTKHFSNYFQSFIMKLYLARNCICAFDYILVEVRSPVASHPSLGNDVFLTSVVEM